MPAPSPAPSPGVEQPGELTIPPVTVTAPPRRTPPRAQPAQAAPAPAAGPAPTPVAATPPAARTATPGASAQPYAPLGTINSGQIEQSTSNSFGNLFFTAPGATSAGLAPGAARPILRGLSDSRVRIQENGIGSGDVSDLGQDHGVPIDPLAIQSVNVLRGPEALRFGSQAVGGVVEANNNRIPTAAPLGGLAAELKAGLTSVNNGWESGLLLDAGGPNAAIHADIFGRHANDYRIPSYPYLFPPFPPPVVNGRQPNSSLFSEGGAAGSSYLFNGGYAGVSISRFASDYHIPTLEGAETQTHIRMEQTKFASKGEYRPDFTGIAALRYWAGYTDYKHDEIGLNDAVFEQIGATFKKRTSEAKAEIESMPMLTPFGALTTAVGTQFDHAQIDTAGDAGSLLGSARTIRASAYFFNTLRLTDTWRTLLAGRIEQDRVDGTYGIFPAALVPPPDDPALSPASLHFVPKSISFSLLKDLPSDMVASATVQRIQRAPTALELFAHGAHDAPGTFEIGNPTLQIETANTAELGLKRTFGAFRFDAKAYYTRYDNFIYRQFTGIACGEDFASCGNGGTEFLQTLYSQHDAIFRGTEAAWQWDLVPVANGIFGIDGQYDFVRATFTDGSNVPQMPPMRLGGGAYWRSDNWFVRMGLLHAWSQNDVGQYETSTAGYNLLRSEIVHKKFWKYSPWGPIEVTTGISGDNLLNVDVRNSTQFHKDEILLPGRNIKFYLNVKYDADKFSGPPGYFKAKKGYGPGYGAPMVYKTPVATAWNWGGLYLGVNAGYSAGRTITDASYSDALTGDPLFATNSSDRLSGGIFGGQAGYNWLANIWAIGIEADMQYASQHGGATSNCFTDICNAALAPADAPVSVTLDHKLAWFGTLRGRFGTTIVPEALAYVTAGVALGDITIGGTLTGFDGAGNASNAALNNHLTRAGWTIGAGFESCLVGNWTGKIEYLHMDFGSVATIPTIATDATVAAVLNTRITDNIVRAGLNYKFDWGGPISAKY